jgi:hypothetical protein
LRHADLRLSATIIATITAVAQLAGCALELDPAAAPDEELGEVDSEIIQGFPEYNTHTASVWLGIPGAGACTGTVLSDHWILTAAHCLKNAVQGGTGWVMYSGPNTSGAVNTAYAGPMELYSHPSWGGGEGDRSYDLGLVHLLGKAETSGLRAAIYADATKRPWLGDLGPEETYVEGFGRGTNRGGAADCGTSSSSGWLRSRYRDAKNRTSNVTVEMGDVHCPGDSGSPWAYWLWSASEQRYVYLQYAVHGGQTGVFTKTSVAAVLPPYRSWIESTINARLAPSGIGATPRTVTTSNGTTHGYITFAERLVAGPLKNGNGWCLTSTGPAEGAPVTIALCNGSAAQHWIYLPNGWVINGATSMLLDALPEEGYPVRTFSVNGNPAQRFRYDRGALHIGENYGLCVDVRWSQQYEGVPLWAWGCNGTTAQRFEF